VVADPALGLRLQQAGKGRLLATASSYATDFTAHVIFATDAVLAAKPQSVRGFLAGWFETIRWMRAHHAESVAVATEVTGLDSAVAGQAFDLVMPMFTEQGHFNQPGLRAVAQALSDLQLVEATPDLTRYVAEGYLPQ
jgi:NitT/TauT family transport system substrate-binding protein